MQTQEVLFFPLTGSLCLLLHPQGHSCLYHAHIWLAVIYLFLATGHDMSVPAVNVNVVPVKALKKYCVHILSRNVHIVEICILATRWGDDPNNSFTYLCSSVGSID